VQKKKSLIANKDGARKTRSNADQRERGM